MARKASVARPVCPKVSKSDFGRNEPCNFGLNSRGLGLFRTMLDTLPCCIKETVSLAGGIFQEKLICKVQSYCRPHGFFIFFTYENSIYLL